MSNEPQFTINEEARSCHVELMFPRSDSNVHTVTVGLCETRAADDLTIRYDFDRDGWTITRELIDDDGADTGARVELAFIDAYTDENGARA